MTPQDLRKQAVTDRDTYYADFLEDRGIEVVCTKCSGLGTRGYASTATWRGGVGGMMITQDVCDHCWGSGDENKHGADLRAMIGKMRGLEAEIERLRRGMHSPKRRIKDDISVYGVRLTPAIRRQLYDTLPQTFAKKDVMKLLGPEAWKSPALRADRAALEEWLVMAGDRVITRWRLGGTIESKNKLPGERRYTVWTKTGRTDDL